MRRRNLSECDFVYVWVDGIHFNIRLEEDRLCTLVILGVRADGTKELVALEDGYRESAEKLGQRAARPARKREGGQGRAPSRRPPFSVVAGGLAPDPGGLFEGGCLISPGLPIHNI